MEVLIALFVLTNVFVDYMVFKTIKNMLTTHVELKEHTKTIKENIITQARGAITEEIFRELLTKHADKITQSLKGIFGYYMGKSEAEDRRKLTKLEELTSDIIPLVKLIDGKDNGGGLL